MSEHVAMAGNGWIRTAARNPKLKEAGGFVRYVQQAAVPVGHLMSSLSP